jgi:hypothetical protein
MKVKQPYGPNIMVAWLELLYIQEVMGLILKPGDWLSSLRPFVVFLSPSKRIPG